MTDAFRWLENWLSGRSLRAREVQAEKQFCVFKGRSTERGFGVTGGENSPLPLLEVSLPWQGSALPAAGESSPSKCFYPSAAVEITAENWPASFLWQACDKGFPFLVNAGEIL